MAIKRSMYFKRHNISESRKSYSCVSPYPFVAKYTYTLDVRLRIVRFSHISLVSQSLRVVHILELDYSRPRERPHSFSHIPFAKLYSRPRAYFIYKLIYVFLDRFSLIRLIAYTKQRTIRGESIARRQSQVNQIMYKRIVQ